MDRDRAIDPYIRPQAKVTDSHTKQDAWWLAPRPGQAAAVNIQQTAQVNTQQTQLGHFCVMAGYIPTKRSSLKLYRIETMFHNFNALDHIFAPLRVNVQGYSS